MGPNALDVAKPPRHPLDEALASVVDAVFVNPEAPNWIVDLTEAICARFEPPWPVFRSVLNRDPIY